MVIMTPLVISLLVTAIIYAAIMVIFWKINRLFKTTQAAPMSMILVGIHGIIYSIVAIWISMSDVSYSDRLLLNYWSITLRLHSLITIFSFGYWYLHRGENEY